MHIKYSDDALIQRIQKKSVTLHAFNGRNLLSSNCKTQTKSHTTLVCKTLIRVGACIPDLCQDVGKNLKSFNTCFEGSLFCHPMERIIKKEGNWGFSFKEETLPTPHGGEGNRKAEQWRLVV